MHVPCWRTLQKCSSRWTWLCCCRQDTPRWQLMPELQHEEGDHLIAGKDTYDCFQVRQLSGRQSAESLLRVTIQLQFGQI